MKFIEFSQVSKSYGGKTVLHDFSLGIDAGERVAILGPSGCGKSTVLRLLAGFVSPDAGSIRINGEVVAANGRIVKEPEQRQMGMVFQDLALWPHLTVSGNLEFGLKAKRTPQKEREERIRELLKLVEMEDYRDSRPAELSGGQQQRVALARALVLRPTALLMDEPLSSLDTELNIRLRQEILRLHNEIGFTLIYVTHDREEAFDIGTRVVIMGHGTIQREGAVARIRELFRDHVSPLGGTDPESAVLSNE